MIIREVSDLHLEHHYDLFDAPTPGALAKLLEILPPLPEDSESVLVIGGDIATIRRVYRIITLLKMVIPRFKYVIYVLGNHEHYGVVMDDSMTILHEAIATHIGPTANLSVVGNNPAVINIDDYRFLCGTLWTDYGTHLDDAREISSLISTYITDHKLITKPDGAPYYPCDLAKIHEATVAKFGEWMEGRDNSKTIVCTHHMPSFQAVHPMYAKGDRTTLLLNHAFASNLDDFILKHQPAAWTFGHTHTQYRGKIGKTQLFCNPLGYPKEGNARTGIYDPIARLIF